MTKKKIIISLMSIVLVTLMILMSEVFQEKEFIFPEITALVIGFWLADKQVWKTSKIRLVILITIFAIIGVCLVKYLIVAKFVKVIFGFVICLVGLSLSKTTFAPLISATILPIIINTNSWLYPIFACFMSILIVLGRSFLEYRGYLQVVEYKEVNNTNYLLNIKRIIVVSVFSYLALYFSMPYMIAPPLMVGFVELSGNHKKLQSQSIQLIGLVFLLTLIGSYSRILICNIANMPLTLCAMVIIILMLIVLDKSKLYFPPSGALAILPLLIDKQALYYYPIVVTIGFIIFVIMAHIIAIKQ